MKPKQREKVARSRTYIDQIYRMRNCSDLSFGFLLLLSSRSPRAACPERTIMPFFEEKADADHEET